MKTGKYGIGNFTSIEHILKKLNEILILKILRFPGLYGIQIQIWLDFQRKM